MARGRLRVGEVPKPGNPNCACQVACLHLKCWTTYFNICLVIPIHASCERAQRAEPLYRYTAKDSAAVVCTSMYVEPRAQQSTAQHSSSAITSAQSSKRSNTCRYEYVSKDVGTCMLRPVCFPGAWGSWHLQIACLHAKCWTMYFLHLSAIPIHSSSRASVAGGAP